MADRRGVISPLAAAVPRSQCRPQCHLPCWPTCREASSSTAAATAVIDAPRVRTRSSRVEKSHSAPEKAGERAGSPTLSKRATTRTREGRTAATGSQIPRWTARPGKQKERTLDDVLTTFPDEAFSRPSSDSGQAALHKLLQGRNTLHRLLQLPATTKAIAQLLPVVTSPVDASEESVSVTLYDTRLRQLGWYMLAASRAHAYTYLRPAVDEALRLLREATRLDKAKVGTAKLDPSKVGKRKGKPDVFDMRDVAVRTISRYHRLLVPLAGCEDGPGETALSRPAAVHEQMARVMRDLVDALEAMSSTTMHSATLSLRPTSFDAFLSPRLLTPSTLRIIMAHVKRIDISLTPPQWLAIATVYLHIGNHKRAMFCLARATHENELDFSHRLMAAEGASNFTEAVSMLTPIVANLPLSDAVGESDNAPPAPKPVKADWATTMRAWSILLSCAANDESVSAEQLIKMAKHLPQDMAVSYTTTPVMHGLLKRGQGIAARAIWRDVQTRYQAVAANQKRQHLDAPGLTVGLEVQFVRGQANPAQDPMRHSIKAADHYASRPAERLSDVLGRRGGGRAIQLDTQAFNVLLGQASRAGRPSVAFRLWEAALPRWGVWHDDISLTLLLDGARMCVERGFDPGLGSVRGRLRALGSALYSSARESTPDVDWRHAPATQLLDPPSYSWHDEYGPAQPWSRARTLFHKVVLGNWPDLTRVPSPLGKRSFLGIKDLIAPQSISGGGAMPPPSPDAKYAHIIPTAATWQAYMALLRAYGSEWARVEDAGDEAARTLRWMRNLGTKPTWQTTLDALVQVGEHEGPRRHVRINGRQVLARDEEILRAWLSEWLPEVPSEKDVAGYRRRIMNEEMA